MRDYYLITSLTSLRHSIGSCWNGSSRIKACRLTHLAKCYMEGIPADQAYITKKTCLILSGKSFFEMSKFTITNTMIELASKQTVHSLHTPKMFSRPHMNFFAMARPFLPLATAISLRIAHGLYVVIMSDSFK